MKIDKGSFINDFIDKNLRQYSIPVYQRNYEWSAEQCEKLFEDIIQAHKLDRYHFTGSVVYSLLKTENKIDYYIIIDGQQRLTTIYILLKALIDVAETDAEKEALLSLMFNQDKFKKYNIDDSSKLKLKPIKSDNQQLILLMENHMDKMDKSSGIYQNYALFCKLAKSALEEDHDLSIEKIYDGIGHLTCAMIKLEEEEKGKEQEIFERINSTGVPLSLADKIRNFVLMTEADQDRLYEEYWLCIEQKLSKEQMSAFFLDYLNMRLDGFVREKDAYDNFKELFQKNNYTNEAMLAELRHYATQYSTFINGDHNLGESANKALEGLHKLKQTTVYLFLFHVFDDYEAERINEIELTKVLQLLLNYSIRRLICEVGSNSLRGLYKTLYSRVFNCAENKNHYYDAIVSFLMQLTSKDVIPSDDDFVLALKERNLYRKNALCKYLLIAIENQSKEKIETTSLSIEHIMPQNKNLSLEWQTNLGPEWQEVQKKYLHTIGNLTLTAYNSEMSDRPFLDKMDMLGGFKESALRINKYVVLQNEWNETHIQERANELAKKAEVIWPYPALTATELAPYQAEEKTVQKYSLESYDVNAFTRMLFESLDKRIMKLSPRVKKEYKKLYVAYKLDTNFVDIVFQKQRLRISINMKFSELNDPNGICKDISGLGRWGNGDVELFMEHQDELDQIMEIVKQSYDAQAEGGIDCGLAINIL